MSYIQLYDLLPNVAVKETRTIIAFKPNEYNVPLGEYGLVEMYCDDEGCDCQRVFLSVVSAKTKRSVAVITFGWESKKFYTRWYNRGEDVDFFSMDHHSQESVNIMHGIHLNPNSHQSNIAPAVMKMVAEQALSDKDYVARLKRHYKLFRAKIDARYKK